VLFDSSGTPVQPANVLRKRPLIVERGLFVQVDPLHRRMLEAAGRRLAREVDSDQEPVLLPELSIVPVGQRAAPDAAETERRLTALSTLGAPVLLTRFPEVYHLTGYLRRYTEEPMRFVLGSSTALQLMHEAQYENLVGGLLEGLGRLFAENVKIYVYPMEADAFRQALEASAVSAGATEVVSGRWITADSLRPKPPLGHLYDYLLESGWIVALDPPAGSSGSDIE